MRLTGAQIVLQTLSQLGVTQIFAYKHDSLKWLFAEKSRPDNLEFTFVAKPENALYMACGFTRASGKVAAIMVPTGYATTQIISGLMAAYLDSQPILCITGQVPSSVLGTDAYQETDVIGMTQTCSKHNYLVNHVQNLQRVLVESHYLATSGRPGPIVLNLPADLLEQLSETIEDRLVTPKLKGYKLVEKGHAGQIRKAVDLIFQSEKPFIYCGGGAILANAHKEILALSETLNLPVAQTLTGLSVFPSDHPQNLGLIGKGGTESSNMAANSADVLIAIGTRFNPHVIGKTDNFRITSQVIHIDVDPSSIAKNTRVDVPIVGDAKEVLGQILAVCKDLKSETKKFKEKMHPWLQQIRAWKENFQESHPTKNLNLATLFETLARVTQGEAILTCSQEDLALNVAKYHHFTKPRQWCVTGGIEIYGYALSAAIGAQRAMPDKPIFAVTTLKNLLMNHAEFITIISEKIPVRILLCTNQAEISAKNQPNIAEIAKAYGIGISECDQSKTFETQLKKALTNKKPHLFICEVEQAHL